MNNNIAPDDIVISKSRLHIVWMPVILVALFALTWPHKPHHDYNFFGLIYFFILLNITLREERITLSNNAITLSNIWAYKLGRAKSVTIAFNDVTAVYAGDSIYPAVTSPAVQQIMVARCGTPLASNANETSLRIALEDAFNSTSCKVVDASGVTSAIALDDIDGLTVKSGVTLIGPSCGPSGPTLTIDGTALTGIDPIMTLNGGALYNLKISGTGKQQLKVNAGGSKMKCVKASKT